MLHPLDSDHVLLRLDNMIEFLFGQIAVTVSQFCNLQDVDDQCIANVLCLLSYLVRFLVNLLNLDKTLIFWLQTLSHEILLTL